MSMTEEQKRAGFRRVVRALRTGSHLRLEIGRSVAKERRQVAERGRCGETHEGERCGRAKRHEEPHVGPTKSWAIKPCAASCKVELAEQGAGIRGGEHVDRRIAELCESVLEAGDVAAAKRGAA